MAQDQTKTMETDDGEPLDRLEQIIEDARAVAKRVREAGTAGKGKPVNFPRLIGGEIIPMIIALAEELQSRDEDHEDRLTGLETAIGAAGIGTGHPLAAMPAPAAVELLQKARGLAEAFVSLESAPSPEMKEQARGLGMAIDMAFQQAGELEAEEEEEDEEEEVEEVEAAVQQAEAGEAVADA